jgi:SAM-dependent methyltransferase
LSGTAYIHGTNPAEQERLSKLGDLTDEAFLQFVEYGPDSCVLDVGSGLGNLARKLAERIPQGQVWGVERSLEQLSKATFDLPNLHLQQADAHWLPFEDARFDVVYCRYLLEHVADPVRVLQEMRRILLPGGKVFVQENNVLANVLYPECPHFDRLWQRFAELQQLLGGDALIGKKLLPLLAEAEFRNIRLTIQPEVHHAGAPTFLPWIENLIGNIRSGEQELLDRGMATEEDIRQGIEDLRRLMNNQAGSAFFYWNRAAGVR